jgi:hypothetical protein
MSDDEQHLRLLSIFHYVVAGFLALVGCFPLIHLALGIAIVSDALPSVPEGAHGGGPPEILGWMFIAVAAFMIVCAWTLAVCILAAGLKLAGRTGYLFCLIIAGIECVFMPVGTVLGVFTIVVLLRPGVKELFGRAEDTPPSE